MRNLAVAALAIGFGWVVSAPAHAVVNVLWYNGSSDGFAAAEDALVAAGAGDPSNATWAITHWYNGNARPTGSFDVLVVGSASAGASGSLLADLPAFGNRVFVTGQDADFHLANDPGAADFNGPRGFLRDAINWAAGGTGLGVIELSPGEGAIPLADLGITGISGDNGFTDTVVIPSAFAAFPVNTNLSSAGLSNWGTSAHDNWSSISSAWKGINTDGDVGFVTLVSADSAEGGIVGVPEPASITLIGVGLAGFAGFRRRRAV